MKYFISLFLIISLLLLTGCLDNYQQSADTTIPAPESTTFQNQPTQDPIIGSWQNGMLFYQDGSLYGHGSSFALWKKNEKVENCYFIIPQEIVNNEYKGGVQEEWLYDPKTDRISKTGSSDYISRGKPIPAIPTSEQTKDFNLTSSAWILNSNKNNQPRTYQEIMDSVNENSISDFYSSCEFNCVKKDSITGLYYNNTTDPKQCEQKCKSYIHSISLQTTQNQLSNCPGVLYSECVKNFSIDYCLENCIH